MLNPISDIYYAIENEELNNLIANTIQEEYIKDKISIIDAIVASNNKVYVKNIPLLSAKMSRIYEHIKSGVSIMFISAERYDRSRNENELRRKKLVVDITSNKLSFIKLMGKWADANPKSETGYDEPTNEISFMVTGYMTNGEIMDSEKFENLAKDWLIKYDQTSVIIGLPDDKNKIKFKLYSRTEDNKIFLDKEFETVQFSSATDIQNMYKKYINYMKKLNNNVEDSGYGYTGLSKKGQNSFVFKSKTESDFENQHRQLISCDVCFNVADKWFKGLTGLYMLEGKICKDGKIR